MGFQHPQQKKHMKMGQAAAAKAKGTPAHLVPHLTRMADGSEAVPGPRVATAGTAPPSWAVKPRNVKPSPLPKAVSALFGR